MASASTTASAISRLIVPPPGVARHPETITRPVSLRRWLQDLPLANPLQQAGMLHRQLKLLVRDPEPASRYGELLQAYHPALESLQAQVWKSFFGNGIEKKSLQQLRGTVSQLLLEIASGHMRQVNQRLGAGKPPSVGDLYHASLALARLLHWDVLQYHLTRPSLWRQLTQLYEIAVFSNQSGVTVDSDLSLQFDASDAHGVMLGTLVLLLCDAQRLQDKAVARLVRGLGPLAGYLRIAETPEVEHCIPVDMTGNQTPLGFARSSAGSEPRHFLQLDDFLGQLGAQGLPGDDGTVSSWLKDNLLQLSNARPSKEPRRHPRKKRNADYHFVRGLAQVQQRLAELQGGQPAQHDTESSRTGIILEEVTTLPSVEFGVPCRQLDHSVSGAGFLLGPGSLLPPVNSWLLFEADASAGSQANLGFIAQVKRRLCFADKSAEIGVEKLRGSVIAVNLGPDGYPALLCLNRERCEYQLLAPCGSFHIGARHNLSSAQKNFFVQCEELIESGDTERIRVSLL